MRLHRAKVERVSGTRAPVSLRPTRGNLGLDVTSARASVQRWRERRFGAHDATSTDTNRQSSIDPAIPKKS